MISYLNSNQFYQIYRKDLFRAMFHLPQMYGQIPPHFQGQFWKGLSGQHLQASWMSVKQEQHIINNKPKKRYSSFTIDSILGKNDEERNDSGFEENISIDSRNSDDSVASNLSLNTAQEANELQYKFLGHQQQNLNKCIPYMATMPNILTPYTPTSQFYGSSPPNDLSRQSPNQGSTYNLALDKCRRSRTIFTTAQLDKLEAVFASQHYMVGSDRCQLAEEMNLSEAQVKVWFQNRRIKFRKQNKNRNKK